MRYPSDLADQEDGLIANRRSAAKARPDANKVGLAISGGGIRSATFALGVLQALARARVFRRIDYLSTVSGGGYVGSFVESLLVDPTERGPAPVRIDPCTVCARKHGHDIASAECDLGNPDSAPIRWLRENGRYLSPNGSGDALLALAIVLRNWIAVQVTLAFVFIASFLGLDLARAVAAVHGGIPAWVPPTFRNPAFPVAAAAFLLWAIPAGVAYWLVCSPGPRANVLASHAVVAGVLGVALWNMGWPPRLATPAALVAAAMVAIPGAAWMLWFVAGGSAVSRDRKARNLLSNWLKVGLTVGAACALVGLIDAASLTLLAQIGRPDRTAEWVVSSMVVLIGALITASAYVQKAAALFGLEKKRISVPIAIVAVVVALVVSAVLLVLASAIAHFIEWGALTPPHHAGARAPAIAFAVALVLALLAGRAFAFLNQSSHATFYAARLTRAYLGASNPHRNSGEAQQISSVIDGDNVPWAAYRPHESGGPLHLINVTLNETVGGKSQIEQRDRKGVGLAVGPAGMSVGVTHHALWQDPERRALRVVSPAAGKFRVFEQADPATPLRPETLDLGTWVALSGAAVSTGLGSRTSIGLSILCGLFNLRLGRWWDSGVQPRWRDDAAGRKGATKRLRQLTSFAFPTQAYLIDELIARFSGPARRYWYLTDGGHFENTGAYELIRRRLPLIVLIDAGEDHQYQFGDLANLVRKARIDFNAEIEFVDETVLSKFAPGVREWIGTLAELRASRIAKDAPATQPHVHASLAYVFYDGAPRPGSVLLLLKPTVTRRAPLDVLQYAVSHRDFPQQSTADQFFDEEQWESYRKLGSFVGETVFAAPAAGQPGWSPSTLDPSPLLPQPPAVRQAV